MTLNPTLYIWTTDFPLLGTVRLAATDTGLCKLALSRESQASFRRWLGRMVGPGLWTEQAAPCIEQAIGQITAYLSGDLRAFTVPLDLRGTPFQRQVWEQVARIPYGSTASYAEVASHIGRPNAVRAVGAANRANPVPILIPCHRVIGSNGDLYGYGGGTVLKAALLRLEGAIE